jgi:hypothetical protein
MKNEHWLALLITSAVGLIVIQQISKARSCGQACQVILSDARGTLVQDLVTGLVRWI